MFSINKDGTATNQKSPVTNARRRKNGDDAMKSLKSRWRSQTAPIRDGESGVTLIEMMVVLVIIGIVAALIVPNVIGRPDEARVAVVKSDIRTIAASLEIYRLDARSYPTTRQGLKALTEKPTEAPVPETWATGGYLPALPTDPWGRPYTYQSPADGAAYVLTSLGADGAVGGEGVNADISTIQKGS